MKWIKLFEYFQNDFYEKIDGVDIWHNELKNITNIKSSIIHTIEKRLKKDYIFNIDGPSGPQFWKMKCGYPDFLQIIPSKESKNSLLFINIFETNDEWYLIKIVYTKESDILYKCDQLDGLLKLLGDFGIIT